MLKRDSTVLQREGRKLIGILSNGQKKWVNGKPETKECGRRRRFKNRLKKEWVTKLAKNQ